MEIQGLQDRTYDMQHRKPVVLPEQHSGKTPHESNDFRLVQDVIELSAPAQNSEEEQVEIAPPIDPAAPSISQIDAEDAPQIDDLRAGFEANSAELSHRLRQFYSTQGIQAPVAADISVDSNGRVVVANNFEQSIALQAEINDDSELSRLLSELSASASLLRAADVTDDFSRAYERNPAAARNDYAHLFSDSFKFTTRFENDKLSAAFKSNSGQAIEWWAET